MRLFFGAVVLSGCPWVGSQGLSDLRDVDGDGVLSPRFEGRDCDDLDRDIGDCDLDRDGHQALGFGADCDDADPEVHPDAPELCLPAGRDEDCDGRVDDADTVDPAVAPSWFVDGDGDGFGADAPVLACAAPSGTVDNNLDCDDGTSSIAPDQDERCDAEDRDCDGDPTFGAVDAVDWFTDGDGDGFGRADAFVATACDAPLGTGRIDAGGLDDCDDADPARNPAAQEVCGGALDDDCDGLVDALDPDLVADLWYRDEDGDGLGQGATVVRACGLPEGYVDTPGDCDDGDGDVGLFREWYLDDDGDGFGAAQSTAVTQCGQPAEHVANQDDCDDGSASINRTAQELCNGFDDNCDGLADDDDPSVAAGYPWYYDEDSDGFGVVGNGSPIYACVRPTGPWTGLAGDCDDQAATVSPVIPERCNGLDDNCDGTIDLNAVDQVAWFPDGDGDGFGSTGVAPTVGCPVAPFALNDADCDDTDDAVRPTAVEVCDGSDNDCDGATDDADVDLQPDRWFRDADADGFGVAGVFVDTCDAPAGFAGMPGDCDDNDDDVQFAVAFVPDDFATIADAAARVCTGGAVLLDPVAGPYPLQGVLDRDLLIASAASGEPAEVCPAANAPLVTVAEDAAAELVDLAFVPGSSPTCTPSPDTTSWLRANPGSSLVLRQITARDLDLDEYWITAQGADLGLYDVGLQGISFTSLAREVSAIRTRAGSVEVDGLWADDVGGVLVDSQGAELLRLLRIRIRDVRPGAGAGALELSVDGDGVVRALDAQTSGTAVTLGVGDLDLTASRIVDTTAGEPPIRICQGSDARVDSTMIAGGSTPVLVFDDQGFCASPSLATLTANVVINGSVIAELGKALSRGPGLGNLRVQETVFVGVDEIGGGPFTGLASNVSDLTDTECQPNTAVNSCPTTICLTPTQMDFVLFDDPCDPNDAAVPIDQWLLGPRAGSSLIAANRPLATRPFGDFGLTAGSAPQEGWLLDDDSDGLPNTWEAYFSGGTTNLLPTGTTCTDDGTYCVTGSGYATGTWPVVPADAFPLQELP